MMTARLTKATARAVRAAAALSNRPERASNDIARRTRGKIRRNSAMDATRAMNAAKTAPAPMNA